MTDHEKMRRLKTSWHKYAHYLVWLERCSIDAGAPCYPAAHDVYRLDGKRWNPNGLP